MILIEEEGTEFNVNSSYENQDEIDRVVLGSDSCWNKSKERPIEIATKHKGLSGDDQHFQVLTRQMISVGKTHAQG